MHSNPFWNKNKRLAVTPKQTKPGCMILKELLGRAFTQPTLLLLMAKMLNFLQAVIRFAAHLSHARLQGHQKINPSVLVSPKRNAKTHELGRDDFELWR